MYIESLINKSKLGDNAAFTELVNLIYKRMYVIAKSRLDIEEDANDAVQEAIISIHKNLKKLKDEKKFNSWSTIILINKCKEIEGKRNKNIISIDEKEIQLNDECEYSKLDDNISFFEIIKFLSIEEKTLLSMYYSDEYTTNEISKILGINESSIRSKISRAKKKIKDKYYLKGE